VGLYGGPGNDEDDINTGDRPGHLEGEGGTSEQTRVAPRTHPALHWTDDRFSRHTL